MPEKAEPASKGFGELFGEAKGQLDELQAGLASVLPSMPGMSAGKYFDLSIGIDFEQTIMPPCPVFPVPHVGMIFDIFGAIMNAIASALPPPPPPPAEGEDAPVTVMSVAVAIVNALKPSVKVHGRWINNAGTPVMHLPAMFLHLIPLAVPTSSSEMWMGSSTVLGDGGPFSTQFHPSISCNLVGFPSLPRMNKTPRPVLDLMLPTSLLLAILSSGGPVKVGGPPTIDLFQLFIKMGLQALLKKVKFKKFDELGAKFQKKIDDIAENHPKLAKALQPIKCKNFGEPVDAATGRVIHTNVDFDLPGPIPLVWERTYYSDAEVETPLGYNWHHSYNMGLRDVGNGFALRLRDGREIAMPYLSTGEIFYHRIEHLFFEKDINGYFVTDGNKLIYRFEGNKNLEGFSMLSSITNPLGFNVAFRYDYKGRLIEIIDSSNRHIKVENDDRGHVTKVYTIANNKKINFINYEYDALGNMVGTKDVMGAEKEFVYEGHLLTKLTNQSNQSFYWEYEGKGDDARCIHTWGDGGILEYWTEYQQNEDGSGVTITRDSLGHVTEYHYNSTKLIFKIFDANGGITRQIYNELQDLEVVVNPEGGSIRYAYNPYGKITRVENENDEASIYAYDDRLNLIYASSPGGMSASWEYDEQNRLIGRTKANGVNLEYEYEGKELRRIIDDKDRTFELTYDKQHNLSLLRYPNGLDQVWEYDDLANSVFHRDVRGNSTHYKYNDAGQVIELKEPDGNVHHFDYDLAGNLIEAKDYSHLVQFDYGPLGVLRERKQNNRTIRFNYDTELQLRSIVNEGGEIYKFGLDPLGNVIGEWGFDGLHRRYNRDANGRVVKVLRPEERWTTYDYDSVGNIVKEEHSDGSMAAYKYNPDSLLTEAINENSHIQLERDRAGRIVKEIQDGHEVIKSFDEDGNCIYTGSSLGAVIEMEYNEWGMLTKMTGDCSDEPGAAPRALPDPLEAKLREIDAIISKVTGVPVEEDENTVAANENAWKAQFQRDDTGLELHRQLSGGVSVQTERDRLGRVTRRSIGANNIEQSRTRYDWGKGNKLNKLVNELTHAHANFEYDAFDNLISASYENKAGVGETIYRMPDKMGNLYKTKDKSDRKYSKGGRLQEDDKYAYHYDGEGNIILKEFKVNENIAAIVHTEWAKKNEIDFKRSGTGWIYEWAGNGMLKKVINPGGREIEFYYDPLGRRTAKIVKDESSRFYEEGQDKITRWVWDGNVPLHEWQYTGTYPPQQKIAEDGSLAENKEPIENLTTWCYEPYSFVPCAKIIENKQYSIVSDYLGTPTHAYNRAGEKVWERELDIYGAVLKESGEKGLVPQLYQGQYVDAETGLAYNRFRYYDNESGNYVSQDPIGLDGNNPTLYCFVIDTNLFVDIFGLKGDYSQIPVTPGHQRHHVIPQSMANHNAITSSGYDVHSSRNIVQLPTNSTVDPSRTVHRGMHTKAYDDMIRQRLNEIDAMNASPEIKRMHIQALSDDVADDLRNKRIQLNSAH